MLARARFIAIYAVFWAVYFEAARAVFLIYQWRNTVHLGPVEVAGSFLLGLKLDISAAAVLTMLPLCLVARAGFIPTKVINRVIVIYTMVCITVVAAAMTTDLEMFKVWGHRIDAPSLRYLSSPREAFASASASPLFLLAIVFLGATSLMFGIFSIGVMPHARRLPPLKQTGSVLLMFVALPELIVAERGGLDWRVHVTTSSVYFSRSIFANQAAVNPAWNLVASAFYLNREGEVDAFGKSSDAAVIVDSLLKSRISSASVGEIRLLRTKPNRIVLIMWEGLTSKIIEPLGGLTNVTSGFTRLAREGVLFSGIYASGQRTTNGMVAVFSGLPGHPTANPLQSAGRSASLPRLSADLSKAGYRTGFYYGAPLAFDNRQRYMVQSKFDVVEDKEDFTQEERTSVWGAHDPVVLDRLYHAIDTATTPVFAATLTVSSHEPFDVPGPALVKGTGVANKFLNAQAYSDRAVSEFVDRLKTAPGWDRTLVIIIADHGSPYPAIGSPSAAAPGQFRIPMLWLGGVLATGGKNISRIGAQYDIAPTLLKQLGLSSSGYKFGKDLLSPRTNSFAFYSFQDGFGYVDKSGDYVFDNTTKSVVYHTGTLTEASIDAGRAFQQRVMEEYRDLAKPSLVRR